MLEVQLLGQFEVLHDGERLTIPTRNAQSLFAYLLLNAGQAHRRERLAGLLWPDSTDENARSNLRHELWRLRKTLEKTGGSYFVVDNLTITFDDQSGYSLDVHNLERAAPDASSADELIAALSVYHGELLPGFYNEWVFAERARLHMLFEARMARLLKVLQGEERWAELLEWAMSWIALGEWPEPAYRALITAYANSGDVSRAIMTYERFAQGLYQELGMQPSEQTQALLDRLHAGWKQEDQVQTASLALKAPVSAAEHHPPTSATSNPPHSNLPRPLTSFIGREKEIEYIVRLLSDVRLLTITGSGGVGKTRLAIQVARLLLAQYKDGIYWIELAALAAGHPSSGQEQRETASPVQQWAPPAAESPRLSGADLVTQTVASVLRVPESGGNRLLDTLVEYLLEKQLILVLDNCEHLINLSAALVEHLLGRCPQLTVLTTSREPLGVPGEKAWYLPSLSLPDSWTVPGFRSIAPSEAERLFIERTTDVLPNYRRHELDAPAIAQICIRLDGIPLAIELAAARMNLLSASEITSRLDDRFNLLTAGRRTALPRHQTLHATIEWSYELLSRAEQRLFRRLTVFTGSFTLEAAESVCSGNGLSRDETITLIGRLVDKSLLQVVPTLQHTDLATRYRLLETIWSFGWLEFNKAEEISSIRERHAGYYVGLAEATGPRLLAKDQAVWYHLLEAESGNIRSAIEWSVETDQAESGLRIVGALLWVWGADGPIPESLELALKALALPSAYQHGQYRARTLNAVGYLQWVLGEVSAAKQNIEEALSILRQSNDEANLVLSLQLLGLVLASEGQFDLAERAMQDGIDLARKLGDLSKGSISLAFLGDVVLQKGERSKAKRIYEESVELLRAAGNNLFEAYPLRRLGHLALESNDIGQAYRYFHQSLLLNHKAADRRGAIACLVSMAGLALHLDKPYLSATLSGYVQSQLESLYINLLDTDRLERERLRGQLLSTLGEAAFAVTFAEGWNLSEEEAINLLEEIVVGIQFDVGTTGG